MAMTREKSGVSAPRAVRHAGGTPLVLSVVVLASAAAASLVGLVVGDVYAGEAAVAEMLRGYDLVTLLLVVPISVPAMISARRGSVRGRLVWAGTLAYLAYTYAFVVFGTTFTDYFLLHTVVFGACLSALVLAVSRLDAAGIARGFAARTPHRAVAAVLALLGASLGGLWVAVLVRNIVTGEVPAGSALVEPDNVVHLGIALDLAVLVPLYATAAVLLWRRAAWGYPLAAVALISGTLHQISYLVAMPFQVAADIPGAVGFDPVEPVIAGLYVVGGATLLWCAEAARVPRRRAQEERS